MTSHSQADDSYTPQVVPQCTKFKVPGIGTVCGYLDIEDWKKVLEADAELVFHREQVKKSVELQDALRTQVVDLKLQVKILQDVQKTLTDRNAKLVKDYIDIDEKYQNERVKPRLGSPLAWSVAAAASACLVGVLVYHALD